MNTYPYNEIINTRSQNGMPTVRDPLKVFPADVRTRASDFCNIGEQARQTQGTLTRAWARLDAGWEGYAESDIRSRNSKAMNGLSLMIAMFEQMAQTLVQSVDSIEAADKNLVALFDGLAGDQAGSYSGKPPGHARPVRQDDIPPTEIPKIDTTPEITAAINHSFAWINNTIH
ncbi:MAG: WXG100 family type VII secretion target [Chloroflexota bacterium]